MVINKRRFCVDMTGYCHEKRGDQPTLVQNIKYEQKYVKSDVIEW